MDLIRAGFSTLLSTSTDVLPIILFIDLSGTSDASWLALFL
jgi:hypothetical protein